MGADVVAIHLPIKPETHISPCHWWRFFCCLCRTGQYKGIADRNSTVEWCAGVLWVMLKTDSPISVHAQRGAPRTTQVEQQWYSMDLKTSSMTSLWIQKLSPLLKLLAISTTAQLLQVGLLEPDRTGGASHCRNTDYRSLVIRCCRPSRAWEPMFLRHQLRDRRPWNLANVSLHPGRWFASATMNIYRHRENLMFSRNHACTYDLIEG